MKLAKTLRGRDALRNRNSDITYQQRQILILADGTRDLVGLFGDIIVNDVKALLKMGMMVEVIEEAPVIDFANSAPGDYMDVSEYYGESIPPDDWDFSSR